MGCNSSNEVDTSIVPTGGLGISLGSKVLKAVAPSEDTATPRTETTLPETAASSLDGSTSERAFPLPDGWRVVCRLSAGDVRSRWGSRPRPAPTGAAAAAAAGTKFEADLVMPEESLPLRLPLQLLAKWTEPCVGSEFAGRYEVKGDLPERPFWRGCRSKYFEVYDRSEKAQRALQVCDLVGEVDVKFFVERLQLESLDSENRIFLRLRDVAFALPRHLAVIQDIPCRSLWEELGSSKPNTNKVAKARQIANVILAGLCRLHSCGWAHCSISPDTICLAQDGVWKLTGLESARKVQELAIAGPPCAPNLTPAPEALLGLPVAEKMDVWHLGAALGEALMQQRIGGGDMRKPSEQLCALVDFLGPLPSALIEKHPRREEYFTPEGHVLRPTTPDHSGSQSLEAIEPASVAGEQGGPRPRLLVRALQGMDGATGILDFIGLLLTADPEQRPSAKQAMDHRVFRVTVEEKGDGKHAKFDTNSAEPLNKITRKGTGFVQLGELPDSDDEDEEEEEEEKGGKHGSVRISDSHGDNENTLTRKGTGFVRLDELPVSDDEEEEEEDDEASKGARVGHVQIQLADSHKTNTLVRKGTGFVQVGELPDSEDEEEEEEEDGRGAGAEKRARFDESSKSQRESHLKREGTGFVRTEDLPPSDAEDAEEEEEEASKPKHARIEEGPGDHDRHLQRKGTGFVRLNELPPSDDEDEEEEEEAVGELPERRTVRIAEEEDAHQARQAIRKGTGYVRMDDMQDDEDESEEEERKKPPPKKKGVKVRMQADDDDDDGAPQETLQLGKGKAAKSKVRIKDRCGGEKKGPEQKEQAAAKPGRKGTGFVHTGDLPDSEEEEEEEEEGKRDGGAGKKVRIEDGSSDRTATEPSAQQAKRAGTQFVSTADLNISSDEED